MNFKKLFAAILLLALSFAPSALHATGPEVYLLATHSILWRFENHDSETDLHAVLNVRGWRLHLNKQLWDKSPEKTPTMLRLMSAQLNRVEKAVPQKALRHLKTVTIWVNPPYKGETPTACYHPNVDWLRSNNRDPEMAKSIEITNVANYKFENKRMPYLMLHELAHAYHDQVLGFNNPKIRTVFEAARDSGGYDKVKRFTGRKIVDDKAYAMNNAKEYFAESSEAYFGKNDFFPFNRKELLAHDPEMEKLLSQLWGDNE